MHPFRRATFAAAALALAVGPFVGSGPPSALAKHPGVIEHVIVIIQENRSFDSYFGTYPFADGFTPRPGTPVPDNLLGYPSSPAFQHNLLSPELFLTDRTVGGSAVDPPHDQLTMVRQYHGGRMDQFVQWAEKLKRETREIVMGHYDYRLVPHYWHYAQQYALADHYFTSMFGSSTPAALFLAAADSPFVKNFYPDGDACTLEGKETVAPMDHPNVGSALTAAAISWGWYQGGFSDCSPDVEADYDAHHNPFQYFSDTADLDHSGTENQHDLAEFFAALEGNTLPQVAYVKAERPRNEHPGYSSIAGGRDFVVRTLNAIMDSDAWDRTVVILTFDESGGWYDHVPPPQIVPLPEDGPALEEKPYGLGPRVPTLVISPFAKSNYISHHLYDHASVVRFIEDIYLQGAHLNARSAAAGDLRDMIDLNRRTPALRLDPRTGMPVEG